jgi:hypothetical protein
MASLKNVDTGATVMLECEHLIGRSTRSCLRIDETVVSAQHATVRWNGKAWEIKDLGSLNGTFLDGVQLDARQAYELSKGAKIKFGDGSVCWELVDDSPPQVMVVPVDGGTPLLFDNDLVGIPSTERPDATIFRGRDGYWRLERSDGSTVTLADSHSFEIGARHWRFSCPTFIAPTAHQRKQSTIDDVALQFLVSRDEEYVELRMSIGAETISLGSRGHNYILLTLARIRTSDAESGLPDTACGWVDQDQFLSDLTTSAPQLNIDIFRIRKQFGRMGIADGANIIERRPRAKQLRIGVHRLTVTRT